ncbi:hypothetical protein Hdeb2414_s0015g00443111 [Helianthus debilis subsp. tardiflorus]
MNLDDLEKTRIGLAELLHVVGACSVTLYNMNHDEEAELALKALRVVEMAYQGGGNLKEE